MYLVDRGIFELVFAQDDGEVAAVSGVYTHATGLRLIADDTPMQPAPRIEQALGFVLQHRDGRWRLPDVDVIR